MCLLLYAKKLPHQQKIIIEKSNNIIQYFSVRTVLDFSLYFSLINCLYKEEFHLAYLQMMVLK